MAQITDTEAVNLVKEQVRVLCEDMRALKARIVAMQTKWYGGLNAIITNTADTVAEGRADGVHDLTGAQVNGAVGGLIAAAAAINDEINEKPCVRTLTAE